MALEWNTACHDWADKLIRRESIIPPPIFESEADIALKVFKNLRIPDLPGKPTFGESSEQWVFDFVAAVFGAYDYDTKKQMIREFFLLISKKNTKSTLCAGIMLTALIIGERDEEEHLILAPTKEVAMNAFQPAAGMVRADDELMTLFQVQDHIKTITHRLNRSSLKVVAADTDTVSGKKAGRIMVDELWVFGSKPNADAMLMEATGGQISRDDGWIIWLTTQSDQPPAGVFKEKLSYFRDVRDGIVIDKKSLPVIYEFPRALIDNKAYLKPENFYISNPNLGRSVSEEWLTDQINKLQHKSDGSFQKFIAKHLNIEIGLNLRADRWPGAEFWERSEIVLLLDDLIERSEVITIGIDGGGLDDLLGLYVMGRESGTGTKLGWGKAWAHTSVLERRQDIAPRLMDFAANGEVCIVEYAGQDLDEVAYICATVNETGKLFAIGLDPSGISSILEALAASSEYEDDQIKGVSQGWRLGGTQKSVERWLADGTFKPAKQDLLRWCAGNAKVEVRGNNAMVTKSAASAKIDPLMAMFNAAQLMGLNPEAQGGFDEFLNSPLVIG